MGKGLIAGNTDYDHQSFNDIIEDLKQEGKRANAFKEQIEKNINTLKRTGYWQKVNSNFKQLVLRSVTHFKTVNTELDSLVMELKSKVRKNHIQRLKKISEVASDNNNNIGDIWNNQYLNKEYGNEDFAIVEDIYCDTRDMCVNLLDVSNIAERLNDFKGKKTTLMKKNNPWLSGSFYLITTIVIISGLGALSNFVPWYLFPIVLIAGIIIVGLIGVLQLKNDEGISDKSFVMLFTETFRRLPLLNHIQKNFKITTRQHALYLMLKIGVGKVLLS